HGGAHPRRLGLRALSRDAQNPRRGSRNAAAVPRARRRRRPHGDARRDRSTRGDDRGRRLGRASGGAGRAGHAARACIRASARRHLVTLAFLAVGVALAVHAFAVTLLDMRLLMARETTLLLVMGALALAVANAEEASFSADRSVSRGAQAFTDEAVERLAPGA